MRKPNIIAVLAAVLCFTGAAYAAHTTGLQITPDDKRIIVQKDVGAEHWVVVYNVDDGSVTGNVFFSDAEPVFLWCELIDTTEDDLDYDCYEADSCRNDTCSVDDWDFVSSPLVPKSFFGLD